MSSGGVTYWSRDGESPTEVWAALKATMPSKTMSPLLLQPLADYIASEVGESHVPTSLFMLTSE